MRVHSPESKDILGENLHPRFLKFLVPESLNLWSAPPQDTQRTKWRTRKILPFEHGPNFPGEVHRGPSSRRILQRLQDSWLAKGPISSGIPFWV
jgi:hypothetical protein